ncbi:MAG: hypothetical protein ABEJ60_04655 [Halodesulfurarchaeum sp.]
MSETIDWPPHVPRTPDPERKPYPHGFQVSRTEAFENVLSELEKLEGATDVRIETAARHRSQRPNVPRADSNPADPGVVAYWTRAEKEYAAPCDAWDNLRDNAQAIYHYLSAKRGMERWGVAVENEFSTQRVEKTPLRE